MERHTPVGVSSSYLSEGWPRFSVEALDRSAVGHRVQRLDVFLGYYY